jgi:hypothetical protein
VSVRLWFGEDEWYDGVGFDDDADHAESQAYKRAAAHAGIGLHLYDSGFWLHGRLSKDLEASRLDVLKAKTIPPDTGDSA